MIGPHVPTVPFAVPTQMAGPSLRHRPTLTPEVVS
jgi:hypothetical protein